MSGEGAGAPSRPPQRQRSGDVAGDLEQDQRNRIGAPAQEPRHRAQFRELNEAYELLSDPARRAVYDRQRAADPLRAFGARAVDQALTGAGHLAQQGIAAGVQYLRRKILG